MKYSGYSLLLELLELYFKY